MPLRTLSRRHSPPAERGRQWHESACSLCNARGTRILRDWDSGFAWTKLYLTCLGQLSLSPLRTKENGKLLIDLPLAFVTPSIACAKENGKLSIDLPWDREASRLVDVIAAVVLYIEGRGGVLPLGSPLLCRDER